MENNYTAPKKNWFDRNWKWFVPTGCLTLLIVIVAFGAAIFFGVTSMMKNSDVYKHSMEVAQKNEFVKIKLGNNIQENGAISGSINTSNYSGNALLEIPIKGSKGEGLLHVEAKKANDIWTYSILNFYPKGSANAVNLLEHNP